MSHAIHECGCKQLINNNKPEEIRKSQLKWISYVIRKGELIKKHLHIGGLYAVFNAKSTVGGYNTPDMWQLSINVKVAVFQQVG